VGGRGDVDAAEEANPMEGEEDEAAVDGLNDGGSGTVTRGTYTAAQPTTTGPPSLRLFLTH